MFNTVKRTHVLQNRRYAHQNRKINNVHQNSRTNVHENRQNICS